MSDIKKIMLMIIPILLTCLMSCTQNADNQSKEVIRPVKVKKVTAGAKTYEKSAFSGVAAGISESVLSFRVPRRNQKTGCQGWTAC
jgi:hypothetical protein